VQVESLNAAICCTNCLTAGSEPIRGKFMTNQSSIEVWLSHLVEKLEAQLAQADGGSTPPGFSKELNHG